MNVLNMFDIVDAHVDTAPFRFVTGGVPALHGNTMSEKMAYMAEHYDWMRKRVMCEAGGKRALCGGILTAPVNPEADFGVFYCDSLCYQPMCGGASLSLAHTAVSLGMVTVTEPVTKIVFDTPAGLIKTFVTVEDSVIKKVTLENVPAFLYARDVKVNVDGIGDVTLDIGFGGNFFALVDVEPLGLDINPGAREQLGRLAMKIIAATNKVVKVKHPANPRIDFLDQLLWCQAPKEAGAPSIAQCVYGDCKLDDCPCGTGTCARMARMYAKGQLGLNQEFLQQNNINPTTKEFIGELVGVTKLGDTDAVIPRVSSTNAAVTGFGKMVLTKEDKYREGFVGV